MANFYAFGCSFTKYQYPTWADILIEYFKDNNVEGFNNGRTGSGNQLISSRIWEQHANKNFTKNDIVVICWSNFFRDDRYINGKGWHCPGSIFHNRFSAPATINNFTFTNENQWKDVAHFLYRDCMIITSTLEGLKNTGAKVISTHVIDPYSDNDLLDITDLNYFLKKYKTWLEPNVCAIQNFLSEQWIENDNTRPKYRHESSPLEWVIEDHPLPLEHYSYVENILAPRLDIELSKKHKDFAEYWQEKLYKLPDGYYPVPDWNTNSNDWILK